jgi:hypothetical protein
MAVSLRKYLVMKRLIQSNEAALLHHALLMPVPPKFNGQLQHHNIKAGRQKDSFFNAGRGKYPLSHNLPDASANIHLTGV